MNKKESPSFQEARDDALRALIVHSGLTPDQVSELRLNQVHLATSTLIIAPDEFGPTSAVSQPPVSLNLDESVRRALIAWLVVRPDGPNDHLFPGTGLAGLDEASINQAISVGESLGLPRADGPVDTTAPSRAEITKTDEESAESPPPVAPAVADEELPAEPPPTKGPPEPPAVPLDEIDSLRRRLAEAYDVWAPALPLPSAKPDAESAVEIEAPSKPLPEVEPSVDVHGPEVPAEPVLPLPEEVGFKPPETRRPRPEETSIGELVPTPEEELRVDEPAAPTLGGVIDRMATLWRSEGRRVTFKLSFRTLVTGGLALVVVACCLGLVLAGGTVLGSGGLVGLLAGATPSATQVPSQTAPPATFTPIPSATPTDTATPSPTPTPTATLSASPAPIDTPLPSPTLGPTPTPIIVVVTATPTPEPPATDTPVPTNTPVGGVATEPAPTPTLAFKYPAPVLIEPVDGGVVPGVIAILKWESVGPLADDEWYAVRLIFLQQGQTVYNGDRSRVTEWRVPDRLYYQADGPALEYRWFVFVERDNPDGSVAQLSPESERFVFRWE